MHRGDRHPKVLHPQNGTKYYVALGKPLVIACETLGDFKISVTWRNRQISVNQSVEHCRHFDINNSSCISPSLDDYKVKRVRSRVIRLQECEGEVITKSTLDISVADWTDSGSSYSCITKANDTSNISIELYINVIVGKFM